jgi:Protein of unknown function (DUF4238)
MPFSRDNHFVPELYLKHFAANDGAIRMYRVLVSRDKVPLWKRVHVGGVGYQVNLYTRLALGVESDEIEQWLNRDFETPAQEAIAKATTGARLVASDWQVLARFVAAQIVRTPAFLNENLPRWNAIAPALMEDALDNLRRKLEVAKSTGTQITVSNTPNSHYFPLGVIEEQDPETKMVKVQAKVVVGRSFWIYVMRHLLTSTLNALQNHRWSIVQPADGLTWFTSDDPVVRLNYHCERKYDFRGGWGSKGTEIFLPLSPRHLLYTHIENRPPSRGWAFSRAQTNIIRRIIAEHAHRQIFASFEDVEIPKLRPRIVNSEVVEAEKEQWRKWHKEQTEAERDLGR